MFKKNHFVTLLIVINFIEDLILVFVQTLVCKFRFGSRCGYILFVRRHSASSARNIFDDDFLFWVLLGVMLNLSNLCEILNITCISHNHSLNSHRPPLTLHYIYTAAHV